MQLFVALRRSKYLWQVSTLLSGSLISQIIALLAAPLLTRLYSPEAFGVLALLVAIVAAIAPGVSGRYEAAVVVAKRDERQDFFFIALWVTLAVCVVFFIILLIAFDPISSWLNAAGLGGWLWFAPLLLLFTGLIAVMRAWANASENYALISRSAVFQSLVLSILSIMLGLVGPKNSGLLLANLIGPAVVCFYLFVSLNSVFVDGDWRWDKRKRTIALYNSDFPLFNAPTNMLNGVMTALPVFFLARYFSETVVGYYALLARVGVAPLSFMAESVSRVNLKKVSELIHSGQNPIPYITKITIALFLLSLVPTIFLFFLAPELFAFFFGAEWRAAGNLLVILMPALAVQFVVSTLSMSFIAVGHLRLQAVWQVTSLVVTFSVFSHVAPLGDVENFFWAFMAKDIMLYVLYYGALVYALKNPVKRIRVP